VKTEDVSKPALYLSWLRVERDTVT
jgi:hypothetical protein